ncbi:AAA family ATPase, partial [Listeria monocytogenes]|uniref:AAA family ATPase n=1 Tax=Listeria monocytogenes TaxID=1639 RepID=UPI00396783BE
MSFELGKQATASAYDFTVKTTQDNIRLNKIMAVVGANGSGKTQFLKPLSFLTWYICTYAKTFDSDKQIVIQTHILSESEDATFHMGFLLKNLENNFEEYRYELVINREQIV